MFSFIPQLLIVLAIAGIIIVILRKTPEISKLGREAKKQLNGQGEGLRSIGSRSLSILSTLGAQLKRMSSRLWSYLLEIKGVSPKGAIKNLSKPFSKLTISEKTATLFSSREVGNDDEKFDREMSSEEFDAIEQKLVREIEENPKDWERYSKLGKLYLQQKKFTESIETYEFLVKQEPENDFYYAQLGRVYYERKSYAASLKAYQKAIELAPEDARRYVNLGLVYVANSDLKPAEKSYKEAIRLDEGNVRARVLLADVYVEMGDPATAEEIYEEVLQIEPTNYDAREKLMKLKFDKDTD